MKTRLYILTLLLFCSLRLFAQGVRFTAEAGQPVVGTGEQLAVTFTVNAGGENFNPPGFGSFQVLAGPNLSTSMTSINGNTSESTSYSFILMATKEGEFTLGPASIQVNGHRYTSNPVKIKVVKGHPAQQQQQSQNGQTQMDNSAIETKSGDLSKSIFIRAVVDKTSVFEGQQVVVSYRLYTRIGIDDSQVNTLPELNGFFSQDIKNMQQQQRTVWSVETYKGLKYNVTDIKQSILFPEHAGNLTVDPLGATFLVRQPVPSRNFMDSFFDSYKEVNIKVKSAPVTVHVKPLPDEGKPAGFTGAIGNFSLRASLDKTSLKANEALNYNIIVTGSGNLKLLKNLTAEFPASFDKYDPKILDTITDAVSGENGSRKYTYLLIPRQQGKYTIAPVKFSCFNPASGRYVTLETKPFDISVEKGKEESTVTSFSSDRQFESLAGKDIYGIKADTGGLGLKDGSFFGSAVYYFLLFLGPVGCVAAFAYRNRYRRLNSDEVKVKSRKAGKAAGLRLAKVQKELSTNNTNTFYEEIFKGLFGYLSDKLNIPYANLDKENIVSALRSKAVDGQLIQQVKDTIDICEMARFAPVTYIAKPELFEQTKTLISNLEAKLK